RPPCPGLPGETPRAEIEPEMIYRNSSVDSGLALIPSWGSVALAFELTARRGDTTRVGACWKVSPIRDASIAKPSRTAGELNFLNRNFRQSAYCRDARTVAISSAFRIAGFSI